MKILYVIVWKIALCVHQNRDVQMPTSAHGLPGHMKYGHGPVKNYEGMGNAGIAKKSRRVGKCGHVHALAHHYYFVFDN